MKKIEKYVNISFLPFLDLARGPLGRSPRTSSGLRTTKWEPLL